MLEMTEVTLVVGCDIGRPIGGSLKQREVNLQYTLSLVKTIVQLWKGFEDNPVGLLLWHGEWENPR